MNVQSLPIPGAVLGVRHAAFYAAMPVSGADGRFDLGNGHTGHFSLRGSPPFPSADKPMRSSRLAAHEIDFFSSSVLCSSAYCRKGASK